MANFIFVIKEGREENIPQHPDMHNFTQGRLIATEERLCQQPMPQTMPQTILNIWRT